LSGGERKRVAIGVELVTDPSVIVLDEPTSGLDSFTALKLQRTLHEFAHSRGKTIIGAVHQPSSHSFHHYFDRLYIMHEGNMIYQGAPSDSVDHLKYCKVPIHRFNNPADTFISTLGKRKGISRFLRAYEQRITPLIFPQIEGILSRGTVEVETKQKTQPN